MVTLAPRETKGPGAGLGKEVLGLEEGSRRIPHSSFRARLVHIKAESVLPMEPTQPTQPTPPIPY